jgi:hypothetical protein
MPQIATVEAKLLVEGRLLGVEPGEGETRSGKAKNSVDVDR